MLRLVLTVIISGATLAAPAGAGAQDLAAEADAWAANTAAKSPDGLGPLRFGMGPAQAKRLCKRGWSPPEPVNNLSGERRATCDDLPLALGFEGYSVTLTFYQHKLVSIAVARPLLQADGDPFFVARGALGDRYGDVPDRTDDYRHPDVPEMKKLLDQWGSIYEWRFRRSRVRDQAAQIRLIRFTLDGVPQMRMVYDSQRRQDRTEQLARQIASSGPGAY